MICASARPLPDRSHLLEPSPIGAIRIVLAIASSVALAHFLSGHVGIGKIQNVSVVMPVAGKAGERPAVIHRNEKKTIVYGGFVLVHDDPKRGGAGHSQLMVAHERAVPFGVRAGFGL